MSLRDEVLARLPPYEDKVTPIVDNQTTHDIVKAVIDCHLDEKKNYDKIADLFDAPTGEEIGFKCWKFLKNNVSYNAEKEELQLVRTPTAIVFTGRILGADCKNYSLFTGGIIDALNRRGAGIKWCYRFAAYLEYGIIYNRVLRHVFVVLYPGTKDEIWVDAVMDGFDDRTETPCYFIDKNPHMLGKLSGTIGNRMNKYAAVIGDDFDNEGEDDGGFDLSTVGIQSAGPDINDDNPSGETAQQAATPTDLDNTDWYYDPTTGQYYAPGITDSASTEQAYADAQASSGGTSFWNTLANALGVGGGGGGGGASGGGTGAGAGGTVSKTPTTSNTGTGTTINVGTSSNTNYLPWVIGGVAALALIIIVVKKR